MPAAIMSVSPLGRTPTQSGAWPRKRIPLRSSAWPERILEVSSEDWVECEGSQLSLARWGDSSVSSLTGYVLFGGLATVGFGQ